MVNLLYCGMRRVSKSFNRKEESIEPYRVSDADAGLVAYHCSLWGCRTAAAKVEASGDDAAQLKAAQAEQVKVLTQVVEILTEQQKTVSVDLVDQLFSAESGLCNAHLDSTDKPEKRIALLTKQLEKANDFVKVFEARERSGVVVPQRCTSGQVQYLGVKIKLLRRATRGNRRC